MIVLLDRAWRLVDGQSSAQQRGWGSYSSYVITWRCYPTPLKAFAYHARAFFFTAKLAFDKFNLPAVFPHCLAFCQTATNRFRRQKGDSISYTNFRVTRKTSNAIDKLQRNGAALNASRNQREAFSLQKRLS